MSIFKAIFHRPDDAEASGAAAYSDFKAKYSAYRQATGYAARAEAAAAVLDAAAALPARSADRLIVAEAEKGKYYNNHPVFGILPSGKDILGQLLQDVERNMNRNAHLAKESARFAEELEAVPRVDIVLDAGAKITRRALSDMPEVKYSTVGKSFNRDRLVSFVVVDTETNGLKTQGGRILELSAIRYEDFQPVAAFSTLINPGRPIPADASAVNGITDADVAEAPALAQVAGAFLDFIGTQPLVGFNLPFDLKFLYTGGIDVFSQKRKYFDVLPLCRKAYKNDIDSFSLSDVCDLCRVYREDAHRSLSDCFATGKIFEQVIDDITGE